MPCSDSELLIIIIACFKPRFPAKTCTCTLHHKEIKAYREAEQAGYMTKSQVIAQTNGGDYDDIVSEIAREQEVAKSLDVVLDKDLDLEVEIGSEGNVNITAPPATPSRSKKRKKSDS